MGEGVRTLLRYSTADRYERVCYIAGASRSQCFPLTRHKYKKAYHNEWPLLSDYVFRKTQQSPRDCAVCDRQPSVTTRSERDRCGWVTRWLSESGCVNGDEHGVVSGSSVRGRW